MPTRILKPAPGRRVIDPASGAPLPADGRAVEFDSFWRRRLAEGDVVTVEPARSKRSSKE